MASNYFRQYYDDILLQISNIIQSEVTYNSKCIRMISDCYAPNFEKVDEVYTEWKEKAVIKLLVFPFVLLFMHQSHIQSGTVLNKMGS